MVDYKGGTAIHFANWANNIPHAKLLLINYPKSLDLSLLAQRLAVALLPLAAAARLHNDRVIMSSAQSFFLCQHLREDKMLHFET